MRTPLTPVPTSVSRWTTWGRCLRGADAALAWLAAWAALALWLPDVSSDVHVLLATTLVPALGFVREARTRWRPATALAGLAVSRHLRPGDAAWYVGRRHVERVLVTARRRWHMVIVTRDPGASEGFTVRRTRVFLLPAD